jgi:hypothetical protein
MNLLKFIKNNLFVQNFFASIISTIPAYLEFTIGKYMAIKKAMYITAHDKTLGTYLEFGVFTGSSFNFAMKASLSIDKLLGKTDCEFIGFDSFDGFGSVKEEDKHPRFKDSTFSVNEKKVLRNIEKNSKGQKYQIIKGFFEKTLKELPSKYNIKKARVIMIDCDLKEPATLALNFLKSILQQGTIIIFDDYIFYKGDENKGQFGAFKEFKKNNPQFKFREAFEYGNGSRAFIVSDV